MGVKQRFDVLIKLRVEVFAIKKWTSNDRVPRRFFKNGPTDLKFRTEGLVGVPNTLIRKKLEKLSFYAKREVYSKDAEFSSDSES